MIDYREHGDVQLVQAYLGGEERAFNELHRRYRDNLQSFIYLKTRDRDVAEDLVQEVFLRICRHLAGFDQTKNFSRWILAITSNIVKKEFRKSSNVRDLLFQELPTNIDNSHGASAFSLKNSSPRTNDWIEGFFILEALDQALSKLTANQRQAFILREVEGMSYEQIARAQGCTLTTLRDRLYNGRVNLRRLLAEYS